MPVLLKVGEGRVEPTEQVLSVLKVTVHSEPAGLEGVRPPDLRHTDLLSGLGSVLPFLLLSQQSLLVLLLVTFHVSELDRHLTGIAPSLAVGTAFALH